ncbi:hypothetical protein QQF21_03095 [Lelliottia sp. V89_10]|uniref:hypothetical protein n=1 Tax=Lelliottia wanjuensis TaxID=3050585 RepID=UPI00249F7B03|nr:MULTISPECIES: hypothetical protein [unclassified Lelliottia]MDI3361874.1 hypothetical protein [Lelliottia sp. V89_13]MDK9550667.1 hypothetical protein [Lelliottia sp. V89_5]MDK9594597.1 hypothetical protein [Lelliottia sp. V89_10]
MNLAVKQNELIQTMNCVASKYMEWSLAKDRFISEVINYSSQINTNVISENLTEREAIEALDPEMTSLAPTV